jgi:hypothetical protein
MLFWSVKCHGKISFVINENKCTQQWQPVTSSKNSCQWICCHPPASILSISGAWGNKQQLPGTAQHPILFEADALGWNPTLYMNLTGINATASRSTLHSLYRCLLALLLLKP